MSSLEVLLKLLAVLLLVGANAFFVAAEFALVSARPTKVRPDAERGDRLAKSVLAAQRKLNYYLSSCQVGITLASLGLGWMGEPFLAKTFILLFGGLGRPWDLIGGHVVAASIAFGIIALLHVVLGELAPKALAIFKPEPVARVVVWPLVLFTRVGAPVIWILNESANAFLRLVRLRVPQVFERVHSPEELEMLLHQSRERGMVGPQAVEMIEGVFALPRTVIREVMTPRRDMVAVPADMGLEDLVAVVRESGYSRIPVYEGSVDRIVGVLLVKDLLDHATWTARQGFDLRAVMREPYFVPDRKPVADCLREFREKKIHQAIVVDEFGGTFGLVTLEDLVEEIVGEIYDEYEVAEPAIRMTGQGDVLLGGATPIHDVNERFGLRLPTDHYHTLAGFILGELGRLPVVGDRVTAGEGVVFVVEDVENRRVKLLRMTRPKATRAAASERSGARA
ncbi:MAG: HlyC/CorC family transporter [Gemmatimonadetes bacterium]|nr:HlyC/CorC family transporter [Gemmatimonadota bacterium]